MIFAGPLSHGPEMAKYGRSVPGNRPEKPPYPKSQQKFLCRYDEPVCWLMIRTMITHQPMVSQYFRPQLTMNKTTNTDTSH